MRRHANFFFETGSVIRTLGLTSEGFFDAVPFSHVNGLMRSIVIALAAGASLYPLARFERDAVADTIRQHRISVFLGVPSTETGRIGVNLEADIENSLRLSPRAQECDLQA